MTSYPSPMGHHPEKPFSATGKGSPPNMTNMIFFFKWLVIPSWYWRGQCHCLEIHHLLPLYVSKALQSQSVRGSQHFFPNAKGAHLNPPAEGDLGCWHNEVMPVRLFERGWPHRCGIVCCHGEGGGLEEELGEQTGVRGNGMNVSLILCFCVNVTTVT